MNAWSAAREILDALPEFRSDMQANMDGDEFLFHLFVHDLARFYMRDARADESLARRFWMAVERVSATGDEDVENAIGVSLIETFAWGNQHQRAALLEARPMFGPATRAIAAAWPET